MKKKIGIILIIIVIVAIFVLIIRELHKQYEIENSDLTVKMFYNAENISNIFGFERKEIELTSEQQKKIIKFYKNIKITSEFTQATWKADIGDIYLEFSDENSICIKETDMEYNTGYFMKVPKKFRNYLLNIVSNSQKGE